MVLTGNQKVFLKLLQSGLWEKDAFLEEITPIDFSEVYQLAEEQTVVGLLTVGLDRAKGIKVPQDVTLQLVGETLQLEQRNKAMNAFVAELVEKMRRNGIYALLVKGQGIAQCYERPLWRSCGDVDFFLSESNYQNAKSYLSSIVSKVEEENFQTKHVGMQISSWKVELHGTLYPDLWKSIDRGVDKIQNEVFLGGAVRSWMNGETQVFQLRADEDVVYVFVHILQHFFKEGIGLRQICDWCRLLWTFREKLDIELLRFRLYAMGVESEWKAFASLAVQYLGMPVEAMPLYSPAKRWKRKADKIMAFILVTGNFGHNRDLSFRQVSSVLKRKWGMFRHITSDTIHQFFIFPLDSIKVWLHMMGIGLSVIVRMHKPEVKKLYGNK